MMRILLLQRLIMLYIESIEQILCLPGKKTSEFYNVENVIFIAFIG